MLQFKNHFHISYLKRKKSIHRFLFLLNSFAAASDLLDVENPLSKPAATEIMTSLEN